MYSQDKNSDEQEIKKLKTLTEQFLGQIQEIVDQKRKTEDRCKAELKHYKDKLAEVEAELKRSKEQQSVTKTELDVARTG